ncbi:alpha amylase catalytic region [Paenibacillus algicola]|uniref:Alpha amylase catalytic region n=1 Tax=Paenibacillus algicola TaxID=2565926 RepID=A0A4P8XJQ9_9BACL|nr:S-layer homology domain-containing protein [Paenibacillus algicola]QCT01611.1 alpha amylase catalytic region [Paenibacillus algicola]
MNRPITRLQARICMAMMVVPVALSGGGSAAAEGAAAGSTSQGVMMNTGYSSARSGVFAAADLSPNALSAVAQVDAASGTVRITGTVSKGAGQPVTVMVIRPSGGIDYVDQTSSSSDGQYEFQYVLEEMSPRGTYLVKVGGSGGDTLVTTEFTYSAISQPTPPPVSVPEAPGAQPTQPSQPPAVQPGSVPLYVVDASSLSAVNTAGPGPVTIKVPAGNEGVKLPYNAGELLGSRSLIIHSGAVSVEIQPKVLSDLVKLKAGESLEGAAISFIVQELNVSEAEKQLPQRTAGTRMTTAGQVLDLDLALHTQSGTAVRLSSFSEPIEVSFGFDENREKRLMGVYYWNEQQGAWEYMGGALDTTETRLIAKLPHFSTFAVLEYHKAFADVPAGHWAQETITTLAARHIVFGVSDTMFAPSRQVSRAEFAALLVRTLSLQTSGKVTHSFQDVPTSSWFASEVAAAYDAGLIQGKSAKAFEPHAGMTREEMAVMLVRAYELSRGASAMSSSTIRYEDQNEIASWAQAHISRGTAAGLLNGAGGSRFLPKASASRAEAAQAVANMLTALEG